MFEIGSTNTSAIVGWVVDHGICPGRPIHRTSRLVTSSYGAISKASSTTLSHRISMKLQARIQDTFVNLPQEMIDRAIECYERRLQRCIDVDGRNVEQNYADEGNFPP